MRLVAVNSRLGLPHSFAASSSRWLLSALTQSAREWRAPGEAPARGLTTGARFLLPIDRVLRVQTERARAPRTHELASLALRPPGGLGWHREPRRGRGGGASG